MAERRDSFSALLRKHFAMTNRGSHTSLNNTSSLLAALLRRERDSNPRRCDPQRFSRPPQSTTLPSLRMTCAKVGTIFESAKLFGDFFRKSKKNPPLNSQRLELMRRVKATEGMNIFIRFTHGPITYIA